jgi:hypothetical protein
MVQSNNVDIADSDEDEHDDHVPTTTKVTDALFWAQQLQEYAFAKPEYFSPESVQALRTILQQRLSALISHLCSSMNIL